MTIDKPYPGSFRTYSEKMLGPMAGFLVGWVYWTGLTLAMSSELDMRKKTKKDNNDELND